MAEVYRNLDVSAVTSDQAALILHYASDVRKLEIDKFWQRSLFFWGFIGAAFVAFGTLYSKDALLTLLVACFGLISSLAWTLQNRGSKYWQEAWENKVESVERTVLSADLFSNIEPRQSKGIWGAQRYSVTRLAIALSDFTVLVWAGLVAAATQGPVPKNLEEAATLILSVTATYCVLLIWRGRSDHRRRDRDPGLPPDPASAR